eukprot:TRINITY_DN1014_c0_g1_i1.p1 TRINITY_DN1014_c0_g1~~TRINITY_DN1014_c0_g1_i1.p1  ORF type:complete len:477 (-),score=83.77 TRINITY_DN1014_c0_g1_i1:179-1609(-)
MGMEHLPINMDELITDNPPLVVPGPRAGLKQRTLVLVGGLVAVAVGAAVIGGSASGSILPSAQSDEATRLVSEVVIDDQLVESFSCDLPIKSDSKLVSDLFNEAKQHLKANVGKTPAYLNGGQPQDFLCNSIKSVLNALYPPIMTPFTKDYPNAPAYFQQADRDSCSLAAMALAMSRHDPVKMIGHLCDLYFKGEINSVKNPIKPRSYIFELKPSDDKKCPWCQVGPAFVWSTALRDARNQYILAADSDSQREALTPLSHLTLEPIPGAGTQGGSGASYFATAQDVNFWCQQFMPSGTECKWIQGGCGDDDDCKNMLNDLLPESLVGLQAAVLKHEEYTGPSDRVKELLADPKVLEEKLLKYYQPLTPEDLKTNAPAILGINTLSKSGANMLEARGDWCTLESQPPGLSATAPTWLTFCETTCDGAPCIADHYVVLLGCEEKDGKEICAIWTWGTQTWVLLETLASLTTTLVSFTS